MSSKSYEKTAVKLRRSVIRAFRRKAKVEFRTAHSLMVKVLTDAADAWEDQRRLNDIVKDSNDNVNDTVRIVEAT